MFLVNPGAPPTGSAAGPGAVGLQAIANTGNTGLSSPHNTMHPWAGVYFLVKT